MRVWILIALMVGCSSPPADPAASPSTAPASTDPDDQPAPMGPSIVTGTLHNGLVYYVQPSSKPAHQVTLRLVVKVGSAVEDPDQHGAAHFVEHLAFAGTKHFPKNAIVDFSEKIGMRFGGDLSAHTLYDDTYYELTAPTDDPKKVDTALAILRDWASEISFEPAAFDHERDVITEERRLRNTPQFRAMSRALGALFPAHRTAVRRSARPTRSARPSTSSATTRTGTGPT